MPLLFSTPTGRFRRFLALLVCVALLAAPARALTVIPPDFKTMVAHAEVIFRGQVTAVRSEWQGQGSQRCIVTYVTFAVDKTLKGTAATPYVLKMLGGTVGDQAMEIPGAPTFAVGDRTLLFVEHNGTQYIPLVGIMHGYYRLHTDAATGQETVLRFNGQPLHSTAEIDQTHAAAFATGGTGPTPAAIPGAPMKRDDFEAAIQRQLQARP